MMRIKGIESSRLSFTKSCCDGNNNKNTKNLNGVFANSQSDSFMSTQQTRAEVKNDLATRIIALQQQVIEELQSKVRA